MLARGYLIFGVLLLAGYGAAEWVGKEFGNPVRQLTPPGPGVAVVRGSSGWWGGRTARPYTPGTRSGIGFGGFGGK